MITRADIDYHNIARLKQCTPAVTSSVLMLTLTLTLTSTNT